MVYVWYKLLKKIIPSSPYSTFNQDLCKDIILMLQYIVYALLSGQSCPMDIFLILSLNSNTVSIGVGTRGRGLSPPFFKSKVRHRRTITIIFFSKILINLAPPFSIASDATVININQCKLNDKKNQTLKQC